MKSDGLGTARSWNFVGRLAALGVVGLASMGCNSLNEPELEVWGNLRDFENQPVRGGVMIFAPAENKHAPWGIGVIGDDGSYRVISADPHKSMNPGRFEVWFRRPQPSTPEKAQIPEKYLDPDNPNLSIELKQIPSEVDITLRD